MATSNSIDFNLNRNETIELAFQNLGIYGTGDTIDSADLDFANKTLNLMLKSWQAKGILPHVKTEATLFMTTSTASYSLPGANASDTIVATTLSADEAAAQTVLSITSTTGMTAADNIGIELDDGTRQWTTIASVDSSTQVTVDDALTGAAASGSTVFSYTTAMRRPLDILSIRLKNKDGNERELTKISREEYFANVDKDNSAEPTNFFYDPSRSTGTLYLWPTGDDISDRLTMTYRRTIQDLDSASDDLDLPQEWQEPVMLNLAVRMAPAFGVADTPNNRPLTVLRQLAKETLQDIKSMSQEPQTIRFVSGYNCNA